MFLLVVMFRVWSVELMSTRSDQRNDQAARQQIRNGRREGGGDGIEMEWKRIDSFRLHSSRFDKSKEMLLELEFG